MIVAGFLGKIMGWKRLMQCGLIILAVGELIAITSPNILIFVYCARILVGLGASLSIPAVLGLITIMYQKKQQAVVFGMIAATIAFASAVVPILSGYIIVYLNWQAVYIILIILFMVSLLYISFCIENDKVSSSKKTFDFVGFILLFLGLCTLIMGLMGIIKWGIIYPTSPPFTLFGYSPCLLFIIGSFIIIGLLIRWERKLEENKGVDFVLIPRIFITNRQTLSSISMSAFIFLVLGGSTFLMFIFLQIFFHANAIKTGYIMMIFALGMIPFSIFTPHFGENFSPREICVSGIIISSMGCIAVGFGITLNGIGILFYLGVLILGIGTGLIASQSSFIVAASIKDKKLASQSSGMQRAMRNIGSAISIAVVSAIFLIAFSINVKSNLSESKSINDTFKQQVIHLKDIPTGNRKTVISVLNTKYSLSDSETKDFINLYWKSSVDAFRFANITLGAILLLFLFLAKDICPKKLKELHIKKDE